MIGVRWNPLCRRDFTQFHNYPRYWLTVVWTISAGVVISLEIIPALAPNPLSLQARFYDCRELMPDLISRPSINFEPEDLGSIADADDWRVAFILSWQRQKTSESILRWNKEKKKRERREETKIVQAI